MADGAFSYVQRNLATVLSELRAVADRVGKPPPLLVAVTKSASDGEVLALAAAGVPAMAENRVSNFRARAALLAAAGYPVPLHLIGSLQKNKVKYIAAEAALIQSLDSFSLAEEIERQGARVGRRIPVLAEVNIGNEESKGGVMRDDFGAFVREIARRAYPHIALRGVMTMAPAMEEEEGYRPYFRATRELFVALRDEGCFTGVPLLSMGMSGSYRVAAEEGADLVRVGRRLFLKEE